MRRATALTLALALSAAALLVLPAGAASGDHYTADADESLADIQAFWAEALPATYGRTYRPIPTTRVHPYSSDDPPPGCGTNRPTPYREVAGNAFYCTEGDSIAYDVERLVPALRERYGDVAVGLVLAHEMGHAVQARVGAPDDAFVTIELQADCFAGAWAAHVAAGGSDLRLSEDDIDRAMAGFLDLRDPSGTDGRTDGAHGNAFDRVSAFQDGLTDGATACRGYEQRPPEVTESPFVSARDQAVNGDPPLDESLPLLTKSLDAFWSATAKRYADAPELVAAPSGVSCPRGSDGGVLSDSVIYCAATHRIVYRPRALQQASDEIGDMGAGVFVAAAWASAVQHAVGYPIGTGRARAVSDCLTGGWAGAVERGTAAPAGTRGAITFSPGDLDEIVAAFVATDKTPSAVDRGSVFDRMREFRRGFDGGPSACVSA
ncbi:MAG: neutral zinc metallopeptidase [Actinomycetota bacterium]